MNSNSSSTTAQHAGTYSPSFSINDSDALDPCVQDHPPLV